MRHDPSAFEQEKHHQEKVTILYWAATVLCLALMWWLADVLGFLPAGLVADALGLCVALVKWQGLRREFQERLETIAFQKHLGNLYVFESEDDPDDNTTTVAKRDWALHRLRVNENPEDCRVWVMLYRDVVATCYWYDTNGKIHQERQWRDKKEYPATETWDQYRAACEKLYREQEEKVLRAQRGDPAAEGWVDLNWFNQHTTGHADQN